MAKKKSDVSLVEILFVYFIIFRIIFLFIKTIILYIIKFVRFIYALIVKVIWNKRIVNDPYEKLLKKTKIFDKSIYDNIFNKSIMQKGELYSDSGKVKDIINNKFWYKATILGKKNYNTTLCFNDDNSIKDMSCTCTYFKKYKKCKHVYALIYNVKCKNNKMIIAKNINRVTSKVIRYVKKIDKVLSKSKYDMNVINSYISNLEKYREFYGDFDLCNNKAISEDSLIKYYKYDCIVLENTKKAYYTLIIDGNKLDTISGIFKELESSFNTMSMIDKEFNLSSNSNDNKCSYTDKELRNVYDLNDNEIKLVKSGEYDPWNFEEEDLSEFDYYYDDVEEQYKEDFIQGEDNE